MKKSPITTKWYKNSADADVTFEPQKKKRRGCLMPIIIAVVLFIVVFIFIPAPAPGDVGTTTGINDTQTEKRDALKKVLGGSSLFYDNVRNDVTGRWRELVFSSSENIVDHAVEYYDAYFFSDDEIHFAVNLGLKTTAVMNVFMDGIMFIDVHEYVDGEEHDAKALAGGDLLKQYMVNLETGEIEDFDDMTIDDAG